MKTKKLRQVKLEQTEIVSVFIRSVYRRFNEYISLNKRPAMFAIGFEKEQINLKELFSEIDQSGITPRLNKIEEIAGKIINLWNNEVFSLESNYVMECLYIDEYDKVWIKTPAKDTDDWIYEKPNVDIWSYDKLMCFIQQVHGYCILKKDLLITKN